MNSQDKVQVLLGWNAQQYADHQYQSGLEYIEEVLQLDEKHGRFLAGEKLYWNWWKTQWLLRTEAWLTTASYGDSYDTLCRQYKKLHTPHALGVKPHRRMMEESFARMTDALVEQLKTNV